MSSGTSLSLTDVHPRQREWKTGSLAFESLVVTLQVQEQLGLAKKQFWLTANG
jgi:hypothetical protein